MNILTDIFNVCIIPLLGVLTAYIVKYIQAKSEEIKVTNDNVLVDKYVTMLSSTITSCVLATNQTYVDSLKNKNAFTKEAQETAFKMTSEAVMQILSDEAKIYLRTVYGDLDEYIVTQIEAQVKALK